MYAVAWELIRSEGTVAGELLGSENVCSGGELLGGDGAVAVELLGSAGAVTGNC